MVKNMVIKTLIVTGLVSGLSAADYDLKSNMHQMSMEMHAVQQGIMSNSDEATLDALKRFKSSVNHLLGDTDNITKLLPDSKKAKAPMAVNSAHTINLYMDEISAAINNKELNDLQKHNKIQKAYMDIQGQCFHCHNLARDRK
ncbi:MAG: hypothetical protein ABFR02_01005 [Campylobacterota bacterium]